MSKAKTEEEFFHTFNALYDAGAQVVLTSDRLPRDLDALEDRLRERFEAGLVTDIRQPDHVMRTAILRKRAQQDGIDVPDDGVLDAIAARIDGSVRELEGALIRVVAYASLTGRPLNADLADEVLGGLYPGTPRARAARQRPPTIAADPGGGLRAVRPHRRGARSPPAAPRRIARPRQLAMYLARMHTKASLPAIGAAFGGRNHTTVMHAVKTVEAAPGHATRMSMTPFGLSTAVSRADRRD